MKVFIRVGIIIMEPAYLASVDADVIAGNRIFKRCCSCFYRGRTEMILKHNNLQEIQLV